MARFRAADPVAAFRKDRQAMRIKKGAAMTADELGVDPWATVYGGDVSRKSPAKSSRLVDEATTTIKQDEPEDDEVALPTPITQGAWKVITPDGQEHFCYGPIPGLEHLWNGSQGLPSVTRSPKAVASMSCPIPTPQAPGNSPASTRQNTRKRNRSNARVAAPEYSDNEDDDEQYCDDNNVRAVPVSHFYIGDLEGYKKFLRRRLDELTMKPLRPIVTAWIKHREPKRLGRYGPYHKQLPRDMPQECTPPWWPRDVPYEEPSHLDKAGLLVLAVEFLLLHRNIDQDKRRGPWIPKLRTAAEYAVQATAPDQFSSSKGSGFSEKMQTRALKEIIPNLFDIAQSHEDHLAAYNLYEGTGNQDPMTGTRVTWQNLTRPPRQPASRKRVRRTKAPAARRVESDADASGDETEVDDTATNKYVRRRARGLQTKANNTGTDTHLPRAQGRQPRRQAQAPHSTTTTNPQTPPGPPVPAGVTAPASSQPDMRYPHPATAPNTSFGQSMHGLHLGETMDIDVKVTHPDPYQGAAQTQTQDIFHPSQAMQYSTSHSDFNSNVIRTHQDEGSFAGSAQSSFAPGPIQSFEQSFSMFGPPYHPQAGEAPFTSSMDPGNAGFPYNYEMFPPTSMSAPIGFFNGLPTHPNVSCPQEAYRH